MMHPTGRQSDNQHHPHNRRLSSRVADSAPYPSATQRHSSSPSSSSMASSRTHRESSVDQQSETLGSDVSPLPEDSQRNQPEFEAQAHGLDLVGQPIHFTTGQFAGCTIRMVLQEIQKADLGRKYARVDRRPLDPPPVVLLRLYNIHNFGTSEEYEVEQNYDDIQALGLLCTVDLFPVPAPITNQASSSSSDRPLLSYYPSDNRAPRRRTPPSAPPMQSSFPPAGTSLCGPRDGRHLPQGGLVTELQSSGPSPPVPPPDSTSTAFGSSSHFTGVILPSIAAQDVVYCHNGFPITEGSKQTKALVGQTFIQPNIVDYMGNKAIVFAFADLAVKIEGTFVLRYRVFDIFSRPFNQGNDLCISAETYGGMFRIYSTKDFPGLSKSTELTKHLARYGLRLNIRETERKRRRTSGGKGDRSETYSDS